MNNHNYKVLIVDDIEENVQLVWNLLGEQGIAVLFAKDGNKTIRIAKKKLPDLILLDINMPIMNGYDTCKILKEDKTTKDIPVIFLTALQEKNDIEKGFQYGAVDFITKPFNKHELVSRIFTHLEIYHSRKLIEKQNAEIAEFKNIRNSYSILAQNINGSLTTILKYAERLLKDFELLDTDKQISIIKYLHSKTEKTHNQIENMLLWLQNQKKD